MSQAIALMPALNGYGTLRESTDSAGSTSIEDTAAETFITNGLSKVLKINNICDSDHLADCGITSKFTDLNGNQKDIPTDMDTLNATMLNTSYSYIGGRNWSYSALDTKAAALFVNKNLLGISSSGSFNFITSTKKSSDEVWYQGFLTGLRNVNSYTVSGNVLCIYR